MLLTSSRPVPAEEIRRTIPGYSADSDDAFHRMFERDKDLLRGIGIPIELRPTDGWEVEHGYIVDPSKYRLADPGLTDEERAALFQAAQTVTLGGEPAAPGAILKLGGARLAGAVEPLAADLGEAAETLGDLFQAVSERRRVRFKYKGERAPSGAVRDRSSPRPLVSGRGHPQRREDVPGRPDGGDRVEDDRQQFRTACRVQDQDVSRVDALGSGE